jgi:hypothetical protein
MSLTTLFTLSVLALSTAVKADGPTCRTIPTDAKWPSLDAWQKLNASIDGRLLRPTPLGAYCHPDQPVYNADKCKQVQAAWSDEFIHTGDPVSVIWNNWNNDTCLPDPKAPCSGDGYPYYVVNATNANHVKAGIDFGKIYP